MQRRLNRFFLASIVLTTLLAGPAFISGRVNAQASNYTFLDSSGNFGSYGTTPGPVQCRYSGNLLSNIVYPGAVKVKARSIHNTQQVHVSHRLYQRLANGSLQFRSEAAGTTATVNKTTFTNVGLGSLSNIVTGPDWVYGHMIRWYTPSTTNVEGWVIIYYTSYQNY
jgi:hypothetical protein